MRVQLELFTWRFPRYRRIRWRRRLLSLGGVRLQEVICDKPDTFQATDREFELYELEPSEPLQRLAARDRDSPK